MSRSDRVLSSVAEAIGDTPLVELKRVTVGLKTGSRILAKLDYLNPGQSKKDRIARQIIEDAEADGRLRPGQAVVELTSGNTGTGLAIVCGSKGYPFVAVISRGNSIERARMMRALGAEVITVDQVPGAKSGEVSGADLQLVEHKVREIVRDRGAFWTDQFHDAGNFRAHYLHTGPEIWRQTAGHLDGFCDFAGTGGTFGGCAAAFKERNPEIRCYVIEPEGAEAVAGRPITQPSHPIQGGGYGIGDLAAIHRKHIDGYIAIPGAEAIEVTRRLAKEEGIFSGFSSGTNVAGALRLLRGELAGKTIVVFICDSGLKYLSTDLWE